MPEVLDHCFWTYRESTPANLSPNRSLAVDLLRPFRYLWLDTKHLFGRGPGSPTDEPATFASTPPTIASSSPPVTPSSPTPRSTFSSFTCPSRTPTASTTAARKIFSTKHTSYVDNLALADRYLAHIRQLLEQNNQWDSSTIIVMGDHSWRTSTYGRTP